MEQFSKSNVLKVVMNYGSCSLMYILQVRDQGGAPINWVSHLHYIYLKRVVSKEAANYIRLYQQNGYSKPAERLTNSIPNLNLILHMKILNMVLIDLWGEGWSNQKGGVAHCFRPECLITPSISNDKGLKLNQSSVTMRLKELLDKKKVKNLVNSKPSPTKM